MTRTRRLRELFEAKAIAHEARDQAEVKYYAQARIDPCNGTALVAAWATWALCEQLYQRASEKYLRVLAAVESDDLEQQLEASLDCAEASQ